MSLTLIGPLFLLIGLIALWRAPQSLPCLIVFFAPFSATAVLNVTGVGYKSGAVGLTPADLFLLLFFFSQFGLGMAFRPVAVSASLLIQVGCIGVFVLSFLLSVLGNGAIRGLPTAELTQSLYILRGFAATCALAFEFCRDDRVERVIRAARWGATFIALWGLLQLLCYFTGLPYPSVIFNNSLSDFADMYDQSTDKGWRIASVAVEPSFFAASLLHFVSFGLTLIVCEPRLRTRTWLVPVGLCVLILILSTSTTGYFGLAVLLLLLTLRWPIQSFVLSIPGIIAFAFALLSSPTLRRVLDDNTLHKTQTGSFENRTEVMAWGWRLFLHSPLLGNGWISGLNANALTEMLGALGSLGTGIFLICCLATLLELQTRRAASLPSDRNWRLTAYAAGVQHALIVSFACSVSSGIHYVVLEDWYFWALGIAIASLLATAPGLTTSPAYAGAAPRSQTISRSLVLPGRLRQSLRP